MFDLSAPPSYASLALSGYNPTPERGITPSASTDTEDYNESQLMTACRNSDLPLLGKSERLKEEINYLFECKKKDCPFYGKSISLLHLACLNKDLQLVIFLLDMGASTDTKTTSGLLPIHLACMYARKEQSEEYIGAVSELIHRLLAYHHQPYRDINQPLPVNSDGSKATLLQLACESGNEGAVTALLENGANPDAVRHCDKESHIYDLCKKATINIGVLKALCDASADVDAKFKGATPLHALCSSEYGNQNVAAATVLIECGASIVATDSKGKQAIHLAAEAGNHKLIQMLSESGADVNVRTSTRHGPTPLHLAAFNPRTAARKETTMKTLLNLGASIDLEANVNPLDSSDIAFDMIFCPCFCWCIPIMDCIQSEIPVHRRWTTRAGARYFPGFFTVTPLELINDREMQARIASVAANSNRRVPPISHQPTAV